MNVMTTMADMVVRSPSGAIALIVEVKARPQATDKWAATLRRNFSAHGMISDSAYFLLALPDFFICGSQEPPSRLFMPTIRFRPMMR